MNKRSEWVAWLLAFAMLLSMTGTAFAAEATELPEELVTTEEASTAEVVALDVETAEQGDDTEVVFEPAAEIVAPGVWSDEDPYFTEEASELTVPETTRRRAAARATYPTYAETYDLMIGLQSQYPEGMRWTNFEPYGSLSTSGVAADKIGYIFQGGAIKQARYGVGCAAFCFILSDAVFGSIPARVIDAGDFEFEDLHVSDFLRMGGHFVTILKITPSGVIVAEANYNKSVHWGRSISRDEVMASTSFVVTRYPEGYAEVDEATEVATGTEGTLTWTLSSQGVLTISGSGEIGDYDLQTRPSWEEHKDKTYNVVIEDGVTRIGDYAFYQMEAMLEVSIPGGVTAIGNSAFRGSGLIAVFVPNSVKTVSADAFRLCRSLASMTLSEGVETVGERAFHSCIALRYMKFPSTLKSLGSGAFTSCESLNQVVFMPSREPGSLTIGTGAFTSCWYLNFISLPEGITELAPGMFSSCKTVVYLYIPGTVTSLAEAGADSPFLSSAVGTIYFGGSEEQWDALVVALNKIASQAYTTGVVIDRAQVYFDKADPFAPEPEDDPGDLVYQCQDGHVGEKDADGKCTVCGEDWEKTPGGGDEPVDPNPPGSGDEPVDPNPPGGGDEPIVTPPDPPAKHQHSWASAWSTNNSHHWHECVADGCDGEADSYAAHDYSSWIVDKAATATENGSQHRTCSVCEFRQDEVIPATGSDPGASGNQPSNPGTSDEQPSNPGGTTGGGGAGSGSTGSGSTGSGGTPNRPVTTTTFDSKTGVKTETTKRLDGSSVVTTTQKDGTTTTVKTDVSGRATTEVRLSKTATEAAQEQNQPVSLPVAALAPTRDLAHAPILTVYTAAKEMTKVVIPVTQATPGTVAVIVGTDASTNIVKMSVVTADGLVASLPDGAMIQIVENGKDFADVPAESWSKNAVDFASARELFAGTSATEFSPDMPMTRAMLMTVLARLDGANTAEGAVWYEKGLEWAVYHGISDGSSPEANISREQLAVMLWRYAGSPPTDRDLSGYGDAEQASGYAQDALRWAVENRIMRGFGDGRLGPKGQATRAQVAQMLMNLIKYLNSLA